MAAEEEGGESASDSKLGNGFSRSTVHANWLTNFHRDLMAGAVMGGVVHTIVAPIERAKLLLQTQESNVAILSGPHKRFKGMFDCIVRTVREEGILSLWRGNGSSVLRYYPSVALNFSLKDLYQNILRSGLFQEGHFLTGTPVNFIAGAAAGCTTLIIVYPLDIAHTRLAADLGSAEARQFRGIYHFLSTIRQKDGIRGIYRGLPASLHGMVVHRGLYFGGFDTIKERMSEDSKVEVALWKRWVAAQAVTTSAGLLSYPLDTVRRRMMMQSGLQQPMYRSTLECWRKIYRTEGVASFYRGALSNMFRSTGAAAICQAYSGIPWFEAGAEPGAIAPFSFGTLLGTQLILMGWVESKRWVDFFNPESQSVEWATPWSKTAENFANATGEQGYPGGKFFDPLGFAGTIKDGVYIPDTDKLDRLKLAEIKHARLAMVAMLIFYFEAGQGKTPLGALGL